MTGVLRLRRIDERLLCFSADGDSLDAEIRPEPLRRLFPAPPS